MWHAALKVASDIIIPICPESLDLHPEGAVEHHATLSALSALSALPPNPCPPRLPCPQPSHSVEASNPTRDRLVCPQYSSSPQVRQVSPSGVAQMLTYYSSEAAAAGGSGGGSAAGSGAQRRSGSVGAGHVSRDMLLTRDDIARCKAAALATVRVPPSVIQMVTDLRTYLQVGTGSKGG